MASFTPARDPQVTTFESAGSTGPGKNAPATYRRTFTVQPTETAEVLHQAADAAREAGWVLRDRVPNGYSGSRVVGGLAAQILIASIEPEGLVWVELSTNDS